MIPVHPVRRPLDGLDPYDPDAVLRHALMHAADEALRHGVIRPKLILVHDDHLAVVELDRQRAGDPVATLLQLADRLDIEHRLLVGSTGDGHARTAWVFMTRNDEDRSWWLATTPSELHPGGLGMGSGEWSVEDGVGLSELPHPARDLARAEPAMAILPARVPETLEIRGISFDLPENAGPPRDPAQASNAVADMGYERRAWQEGLDGVQVIVFRERTVDHWHVTGDIPMGLDDLVRSMCRHGEPAVAAVTVTRDVLPLEGVHHRVVRMVSEAAGIRWERILAMRWDHGDAPEPSHLRYYTREPRRVGADGWVGVEPVTLVSLFPTVPEA